ncbi:MAG TPA: glutathione S-transferase family protein [Frateuria sp.]|uniref:glutathione S-transferase family protein n=1 Tax=Frateuria sp. TaxID=2211372 RepID=UPI002D7F5FED|nr:glutathione S-transferase family protein [Frateuria sp.]HET6804658.1 glutathione S-transferase family protein [Frateuria sp.]
MYTLYYAPGTASMVVHLALLEAGAPHVLKLVDLDARAQRDPAYLELNPRGVVPTLVVDGQPLSESAALLMLLAERHPDSPLAPPPGTPERAAWYQWIVYLSNTLMSAYRFWFYPQELDDTPAVRAALQRRIESVWDLLDAHVALQGPYLLGARFSGADLLLTMLMRWSRNMPRPATEWPALRRLADLVRARPSWRRLYEVEGLREW